MNSESEIKNAYSFLLHVLFWTFFFFLIWKEEYNICFYEK